MKFLIRMHLEQYDLGLHCLHQKPYNKFNYEIAIRAISLVVHMGQKPRKGIILGDFYHNQSIDRSDKID